MFKFKTDQLVRSTSGRLFWVVGCLRTFERWTLQELRPSRGRVCSARNGVATSFTLIGNNYKAKE